MSLIAEFTIPPSEFALAETFESIPEAILKIERVAAHGAGRTFPLCWVVNEDYHRIESALHADSSTEAVTKLTESDEAWLYQIKWTHRVERFVDILINKATVIAATGAANGWDLRIFFENHSPLSELNTHLNEENVKFTLNRLYKPSGPGIDGQFGLTRKQRDILTTAAEAGYFESPRAISMTELADALGISQQAASTRLRRAHANLIRSVFQIERDER